MTHWGRTIALTAAFGMVAIAAIVIWMLWARLVGWYTAPPYATAKLIGLSLSVGAALLIGPAVYFIAAREEKKGNG